MVKSEWEKRKKNKKTMNEFNDNRELTAIHTNHKLSFYITSHHNILCDNIIKMDDIIIINKAG